MAPKSTPTVKFLLALMLLTSLWGCGKPIEIGHGMSVTDRELADQLIRVRSLIEKGDYSSALIALRVIKTRRSGASDEVVVHSIADYFAGLIEFRAGRYDDCRDAMQRWLEVYAESPWVDRAMLLRADALMNLRDYPGALKIYEKLSHSSDRDTALLGAQLAADVVELTGKYGSAVDWLLKALALARSEDVAQRAWLQERVAALIHHRLGETHLRMLASVSMDGFPTGEARWRLANLQLASGRDAEAIATLENYLERNPGHRFVKRAKAALVGLRQIEEVDPYAVGVLLPLTGQYAHLGNMVLRALELGFFYDREWSRRVHPKLIVRDTQGDPEIAQALMEELIEEHRVIAIFGPLLTDVALACAPLAEPYGIPVVLFSAREGLAEVGGPVFQFAVSRQTQAEDLVQYAVRERWLKRFAIFYPEDDFGEDFMNRFWDALESIEPPWPSGESPNVVAVESFQPGKTDFQEEVRKLVGLDDVAIVDRIARLEAEEEMKLKPDDFFALEEEEAEAPEMMLVPVEEPEEIDPEEFEPIVDFDALFLPGYYDTVALVIPQLALFDIGSQVQLLGTNGWNDPELIELAGDSADRSVFVDGYWVEGSGWANRAFVGDFTDLYGVRPRLLEAQAFDAIGAVRAALAGLERPSRRALDERLKQVVDYPGVTGEISVRPNGMFHRELTRLSVKRNRIVALERPPAEPQAPPQAPQLLQPLPYEREP